MQTQLPKRFENREEAGRELAKRLGKYGKTSDAIVLAMPNGGSLVGAEVADALEKPFDLLMVEPITAPGDGTLLGAITSGGVRMLNSATIDSLHLSQADLNQAILAGSMELARREKSCRGTRPHLDVADRTVILVDDGTAGCEAIRDAIRLLRRQHAECVIVAMPAACHHTACDLRMEADEVITLVESEDSRNAFQQFPRMTDRKVRRLLSGKSPAIGTRN